MLINSNVATVELTGSVETVEFTRAYAYYWLSNQSDGVMYASIGEPVPEAEGAYTINPGCDVRIPGGMSYGKINIIGTGKLMVYASNIAECPINSASSGLSDEDAVKTVNGVSPDDKGNVDIDTNVIDSIPVDLTGIYNNQVIGYDEDQKKLVPISTGTPDPLILVPISPPTWEWSSENKPDEVSLTNQYNYCGIKVESAFTISNPAKFIATSKSAYMLSEFSKVNVSHVNPYSLPNCKMFFQLSKTSDFSNVDASFDLTNDTVSLDISNIRGKYYWRYIIDNVTTASDSVSVVGISSLKFV